MDKSTSLITTRDRPPFKVWGGETMHPINSFIYNYNYIIDPRKSADNCPVGRYGVSIQYERSFRWKLGYFRNLCAVSPQDKPFVL